MLRVLGRSTSGNVQKAIWLLEELGSVPYRREDYGRQFKNTSDAAYLHLNPNGKVPTLVDGELAVWESNTILRYLCNRYGGEAFYPADAVRRSFIERWMDWQLGALYAPYVAIFKEAKKPVAERAASFATDAAELRTQLQILERAAALDPWVTGPQLSLADICLGPIVYRCLDFPVDLGGLSKVRAWREGVAARPAFRKAVA